MKRNKAKKLKRIIADVMLYTIVNGMWTSLIIYGFMTATTLN